MPKERQEYGQRELPTVTYRTKNGVSMIERPKTLGVDWWLGRRQTGEHDQAFGYYKRVIITDAVYLRYSDDHQTRSAPRWPDIVANGHFTK